MKLELTAIEAHVLIHAVELVLKYDQDSLAEEPEEDQKTLWQMEINDLKSIRGKLEKLL